MFAHKCLYHRSIVTESTKKKLPKLNMRGAEGNNKT